MTDSIGAYRLVITSTTTFIQALEQLQLLSDRIGADSSLSAAMATAAAAGGRSDLATADFDNFKAATNAVTALMNNPGTGTLNTTVNSATIKLPFYKIL